MRSVCCRRTYQELMSEAYHANRVLFSSYHNGLAMGKLGLFYLDDFTWGPQTLDSEAQQYDGGNLMFAELKIQFPNPGTGEHILNLNVYDPSANPIPNAEISLGTNIYLSESDGSLSISDLCGGSWDLVISKTGYKDYSDVIYFADSQSITLDVTLQTELAVEDQNMPSCPGINNIYPNPFNPETTIVYQVAQREKLIISVYNLKGQKVATLFNGMAEPGEHNLAFSGKTDQGKSLPSGLYLLHYQSGNVQQSKKLILLK